MKATVRKNHFFDYLADRNSHKALSIKRHWYDYLWIWSIIYFALGFFNILFAWLGLIDFILPLIFAIAGGNKWFCNHMCGRGQLFWILGRNLKCSRRKQAPVWISSKWFRYGFLTFFMTMFGTMIFQTYLVFSGTESLRKVLSSFGPLKFPGNGRIMVVYFLIG